MRRTSSAIGAGPGAFQWGCFDTALASAYADEGEDIAIVACGPILAEAMRAALVLKEEKGIEARVVNMHTVKPLDTAALLRALHETGAILSCEEHQRGGFGNIVAGALCTGKRGAAPLIMDMVGVEDRFGESGRPRELMVKFGLDAEHIALRAIELLRRKERKD